MISRLAKWLLSKLSKTHLVSYEYSTSINTLFVYYLSFEVVLFGRVINRFQTEVDLMPVQNNIKTYKLGWDDLITNRDDVGCITLTPTPYKLKNADTTRK